MTGQWSTIVTAPVQKSIIIESGVPFTGHTEFFQDLAGVPRVVMMLTSNDRPDAMKVALATTHLPISALSAAITGPLLDEVLETLHHALKTDYAFAQPRILVTGLNPHAGENGHISAKKLKRLRLLFNALKPRAFWLRVQSPRIRLLFLGIGIDMMQSYACIMTKVSPS